MLHEVTMHKCVCDNCGETIKFGEDWTVFHLQDLKDWIGDSPESVKVIDGKHICTDCIIIDENGEEIIKPTNNTNQ